MSHRPDSPDELPEDPGHEANESPFEAIERRFTQRRDEDEERLRMLEEAKHDSPLARQIIKTSRVAAAVGLLGGFVGAGGAAMGFKIIGPPAEIAAVRTELRRDYDTTNAKIAGLRAEVSAEAAARDSLKSEVTSMHSDLLDVFSMGCQTLLLIKRDVIRPRKC